MIQSTSVVFGVRYFLGQIHFVEEKRAAANSNGIPRPKEEKAGWERSAADMAARVSSEKKNMRENVD